MGKTAKKQVAVAPLRRLMGKSPPDGPKAKGMKPKKPLIQTKGVKDTKRKVKETLKESKTTTKKVEKPKGQVGKSGVSEPSQRRSALRKPVAKEPAEVAIQKVASEKDKRNKLSLLKKKLEEYKSKEEEEAEQSGSESCDMEKELESILEAKKSNKANKNEKKTEEEESEEDGEDEEDEEEVEQNTENQSTDEESEGDSAGDEEESSSAAESDQDEVEGEGAEGAEGGEGAEGEAGTDGEHPAPTSSAIVPAKPCSTTARTAAGLYYNSDDFPDDELERFYYMKKPREVNRRQVTSDSTQVKADANLDNDMLNALVDENEGVMRAGALPECFASNTAGQKALMDGLFDGVVAAPKKKAKKEEEKSKEVQPKTLPQKACDLMADILSDSTKARKKSMSLGAVNYAGELSNQLLDFAKKMEHSYKTLQKATNNNVDKEDFYLKIFAEVAKQREWFVQAEAAADSILSGLKRASRKKDGSNKEEKEKSKKTKK